MTLEHHRPLRADAERNRRRILAAAAEVFADRGLDAGLDEIARRAGVGTGTVYRRFPDKAALIRALFVDRVQALVEIAAAARAAPDAWTGLVTLITGWVELHLSDRGLKQVVYGDSRLSGEVHEQVSGQLCQLEPALASVLDRARAAGQVRDDITTADLSVSMFMLSEAGVYATREQCRRQLTLVLDGLRPRRPPADDAPEPVDRSGKSRNRTSGGVNHGLRGP